MDAPKRVINRRELLAAAGLLLAGAAIAQDREVCAVFTKSRQSAMTPRARDRAAQGGQCAIRCRAKRAL